MGRGSGSSLQLNLKICPDPYCDSDKRSHFMWFFFRCAACRPQPRRTPGARQLLQCVALLHLRPPGLIAGSLPLTRGTACAGWPR